MTTIIFNEPPVGVCVPASELQLQDPEFDGKETLVYVAGGYAHEVLYLVKTPGSPHFQVCIVAGPAGEFYQHMYVPCTALATTIKRWVK